MQNLLLIFISSFHVQLYESLKQKAFEPLLLGCMVKIGKKEEGVIDIIKKVEDKIKAWIKFGVALCYLFLFITSRDFGYP